MIAVVLFDDESKAFSHGEDNDEILKPLLLLGRRESEVVEICHLLEPSNRQVVSTINNIDGDLFERATKCLGSMSCLTNDDLSMLIELIIVKWCRELPDNNPDTKVRNKAAVMNRLAEMTTLLEEM